MTLTPEQLVALFQLGGAGFGLVGTILAVWSDRKRKELEASLASLREKDGKREAIINEYRHTLWVRMKEDPSQDTPEMRAAKRSVDLIRALLYPWGQEKRHG